MGTSSPSSSLLHMWLVTGTIYSIGCCITWLSTYKLLSGLSKESESKSASLTSRPSCGMNHWNSTQIISALVCVGFSIGLPLQCVQMFYFDIADDKSIRKHGNTDRWMDYLNEPMAWGFGIPATTLIIGSVYCDVYVNISRLCIFEDTCSRASNKRMTGYYSLFALDLGSFIIWALWFAFLDAFQSWFLALSGLIMIVSLVLQFSLAREFVFRLAGFIRMSRHNNDPTQGRVRSVTLSDVISAAPTAANQSLSRIIIKQVILSIAKILSLVVNGITFLLSVTLVEGLVNSYMRAGVMQIGVTLPVCIYLSFDFANNDYNRVCFRVHNWIEHFA